MSPVIVKVASLLCLAASFWIGAALWRVDERMLAKKRARAARFKCLNCGLLLGAAAPLRVQEQWLLRMPVFRTFNVFARMAGIAGLDARCSNCNACYRYDEYRDDFERI